MAFKSVEQFNDDRYHGLFRLVNDKDFADVIFLYGSKKDALVADAHYIRSAEYSGYVHCTGRGCPACAKGIRVQNKLFIPLYVLKQNGDPKEEIQFWDRSVKFEPQLDKDVFQRFPNPSEYVFRITRKGVPNDVETKYEIAGLFNNNVISYDGILAKFNAKMPDYYENIIRDIPADKLAVMLQNAGSGTASSDMPDYTPVPRAGYQSSIPDTFVNAAEAVDAPATSLDVDAVADDLADDNGDLADPVF